MPLAVTGLGDLVIGARRITEFLRSDELEIKKVLQIPDKEDEYAVKIENGCFHWDKKISKEDFKKNREDNEKKEKMKQKK